MALVQVFKLANDKQGGKRFPQGRLAVGEGVERRWAGLTLSRMRSKSCRGAVRLEIWSSQGKGSFRCRGLSTHIHTSARPLSLPCLGE